MAKEPQTRFSIDIPGGRRKYVSVLEKKNRLTMTLQAGIKGSERAPADSPANASEALFDIVHHKYSVHPVDAEGVYKSHHTLTRERRPHEQKDVKDESYIHTLGPGRGMVEPLFALTSMGLWDGEELLQDNARDRVIPIARFDQEIFSLHAVFFLAPPDGSIDLISPSLWYNRHIAKFTQVSVIVLESYSMCKSRFGSVHHHMTKNRTAVLSDGTELGKGDFSPPSPGFGPEAARDYAIGVIGSQHALAIEEANKLPEDDPSLNFKRYFGCEPRASANPKVFIDQLRPTNPFGKL